MRASIPVNSVPSDIGCLVIPATVQANRDRCDHLPAALPAWCIDYASNIELVRALLERPAPGVRSGAVAAASSNPLWRSYCFPQFGQTSSQQTRHVHLRYPEAFRDLALGHVLEEAKPQNRQLAFGQRLQQWAKVSMSTTFSRLASKVPKLSLTDRRSPSSPATGASEDQVEYALEAICACTTSSRHPLGLPTPAGRRPVRGWTPTQAMTIDTERLRELAAELGFRPATTDEADIERHGQLNKNADYWLARRHRFAHLRREHELRRQRQT